MSGLTNFLLPIPVGRPSDSEVSDLRCLGKSQELHLSPPPNRHPQFGHFMKNSRNRPYPASPATPIAQIKEANTIPVKIGLFDLGKNLNTTKSMRTNGAIATGRYHFSRNSCRAASRDASGASSRQVSSICSLLIYGSVPLSTKSLPRSLPSMLKKRRSCL